MPVFGSRRPRRPAKLLATVFVLFLHLCAGCRTDSAPPPVNDSVHSFYYGWYANVKTDGEMLHWSHDVLGVDDPQKFPGGEDIGANFYPQLGCYSSNDESVIRQHLEQCAAAGVGVLVASWWGPDSFEDKNLSLLLDAAAAFDIGIAIHLEPFPGRGAASSREALVYLLDRYGAHPAFHRSSRHQNRPVVYIYDSYLTPAEEWSRLLQPDGDLSVRNTPYDVVAIGLWVKKDEGQFFLDGGFDGFYTYFASDGFTYGSTSENWPELSEWACRHGLTFIPCVGPGYIDTRIRPWNSATTRSREDGNYFDRMFQRALDVRPGIIGITSFNEWHEGTQIEPAVPKTIEGYSYEDFTPLPPDYYLERTRHWVDIFSSKRIVAVGDLHGDLDSTREALRLAGAIDETDHWVGGDLIVVQTGDQLDRGDEEQAILELLDRLQDEARAAGGALHILNGNHELMNARPDLRYVTEGGFADFQDAVVVEREDSLLLAHEPAQRARVAAFRPGGPFARLLAERPVVLVIDGNVFVHGGVLPSHLDYGIDRLNNEVRDWLLGEGEAPEFIHTSESPTWTRDYSDEVDGEDCGQLDEVLQRLGAFRMIVGHTVQENGITPLCDDRVWCIDSGISEYYGGRVEVLEIKGEEIRVLR